MLIVYTEGASTGCFVASSLHGAMFSQCQKEPLESATAMRTS
jgi:hypothetical protein